MSLTSFTKLKGNRAPVIFHSCAPFQVLPKTHPRPGLFSFLEHVISTAGSGHHVCPRTEQFRYALTWSRISWLQSGQARPI